MAIRKIYLRPQSPINNQPGTSLAVRWLRLYVPNARDAGLIPGSTPGQGRSSMLHGAAKNKWINKYAILKKIKISQIKENYSKQIETVHCKGLQPILY